MARYIDADKLIAEYDRVHVGPAGGARKLMVDAPTADVVPRAEAENYKSIAETQQNLSMDRYFEIKQLKQELDKAKGKVEYLQSELDVCELILDIPNLKQEIETLKDTNEHLAVMLAEAKAEVDKTIAEWAWLHADTLNKLDKAKAEVAREIFEEILREFNGAYTYKGYTIERYVAKLKKKYTEGEK